MADNAFEQETVEGLAFMTFVDGKDILNVVANNLLYKFSIPLRGVSRLNCETAVAVCRDLHTL